MSTSKYGQPQSSAQLPTRFGMFTMHAYAESRDIEMPNFALVAEHTDLTGVVLVRIHSECVTGDIFHSLRCDCGEQLESALTQTGRSGGIVIYLRQEGRGIGIINKLDAYQLQDSGADTVEANAQLGLPIDDRDYQAAIDMLRNLGVQRIRLLTNNPLKVEAFAKTGIEVIERMPLEIKKRPENERYLNTKRDEMGHHLA